MMYIEWDNGIPRLATPPHVIAYRKAQLEMTLRRIVRKGMNTYETDTELPLLCNSPKFLSMDAPRGDGNVNLHDVIYNEIETTN